MVNAIQIISQLWHSKFKYPPLLCVFLFRFVRLFNKIKKPILLTKSKSTDNLRFDIRFLVVLCTEFCSFFKDICELIRVVKLAILLIFISIFIVFVCNRFLQQQKENEVKTNVKLSISSICLIQRFFFAQCFSFSIYSCLQNV